MDAIVEQFKKLGILPVVVLDDAKYAESLADVLFQGDYLVRKLHLGRQQLRNPLN